MRKSSSFCCVVGDVTMMKIGASRNRRRYADEYSMQENTVEAFKQLIDLAVLYETSFGLIFQI
jgi:hypothetical protein